MGVKLKDLAIGEDITVADLKGKALAVDAFNVIYQFLATIRQRDGMLLTDSKGNVTSHLVGLFLRTTKLMQNELKLAFVFDGQAPELKRMERERRAKLKQQAEAQLKVAEETEDFENMKKFAARTSKLTPDMVDEAKELLRALGLPVIQAPGEGEAQAAHIVKRGDAYACVSQDYDNLLFGVPRLVKNLTLSNQRKQKSKLNYETISPHLIETQKTLDANNITQKQLIALGMLVGTDFNVGGIPRLGPKKGLKLVKEFDQDFDALFDHVEWSSHFDARYEEVMELFLNMPVTDDYELTWKQPDEGKIKELLCDRHDFSRDRVETTLANLQEYQEAQKQKSLFDY